jgi:hypothetical protein
MVSEQDGKIRDPETKERGDGACREKKDAGKGPDKGCLVCVSYDYSLFCIYTQSFVKESESVDVRHVKTWIPICVF